MTEISQLITNLKDNYLPQNNLTARRFAVLTGISRPRLIKLLDGEISPNVKDVTKINQAMVRLEARKAAQGKPAPVHPSAIRTPSDDLLTQPTTLVAAAALLSSLQQSAKAEAFVANKCFDMMNPSV